MLRENKLDELFEYLEAVANSLESKTAEEWVRRLLSYLKDNRNGLIPYRKRGLNLPQLPDGLVYKGMGNGEHNTLTVCLGIMNAARGAGATWTVNNLARYFAMQNYNTYIADMSGTKAVAMMKLKNIECFTKKIKKI